jgi:hypothetical protein
MMLPPNYFGMPLPGTFPPQPAGPYGMFMPPNPSGKQPGKMLVLAEGWLGCPHALAMLLCRQLVSWQPEPWCQCQRLVWPP